MWKPAVFTPSRRLDYVVAATLALLLVYFLPLGWLGLTPWANWRLALGEAGAQLPPTIAVEPWPGFEIVMLLLGLVLLTYQLWNLRIPGAELKRISMLQATGAAILALASLVRGVTATEGTQADFTFHREPALTGFVLAYGALISVGTLFKELPRIGLMGLWGALILTVCAAALLYGGFVLGWILLLIGAMGLFLWLRHNARMGRVVTLATPLLILLAAAASFVWPHFHAPDSGVGSYTVAVRLLRELAFLGTSPGGLNETLAIVTDVGNPEDLNWSSWARVIATFGLPIAGALLIAAFSVVLAVLPLRADGSAPVRGAQLIALVGLLMATFFFDLSGEFLLLAVVLLSLRLLLSNTRVLFPAVFSSWAFRGVGAVVFLCGLAWLLAFAGLAPLHAHIYAENARQAIGEAQQAEDYEALRAAADRLLTAQPLAVDAYLALGKAALETADTEETPARYFAIARELRPESHELLYEEGLAWMTRSRDRAFQAWRTALERAGGEQKTALFERILGVAERFPRFSSRLEELASLEPDYNFAYLMSRDSASFHRHIARVLESNPSLEGFSRPQRVELGLRWAEIDDVNQMILYLTERATELPMRWFYLAQAQAQSQQMREAVQLLADNLTVPPPPSQIEMRHQERERELLRNLGEGGANQPLVIDLRSTLEAGSLEKAREIAQALVAAAETRGRSSPYARYWAGELSRRSGNYAAAWEYWNPLTIERLSQSGDPRRPALTTSP
ncbi:MAG: tetratricopeptide repeat protein [Opitutales bacterium]